MAAFFRLDEEDDVPDPAEQARQHMLAEQARAVLQQSFEPVANLVDVTLMTTQVIYSNLQDTVEGNYTETDVLHWLQEQGFRQHQTRPGVWEWMLKRRRPS